VRRRDCAQAIINIGLKAAELGAGGAELDAYAHKEGYANFTAFLHEQMIKRLLELHARVDALEQRLDQDIDDQMS